MTRRSKGGPDAREKALLGELSRVYRDADALYAGHACPSSSECCRFAVTGREPYVTSIELARMRRAVAARGGPLREKKRALPLAAGSSTSGQQAGRREEGICPLLAQGGRCAIYADRPLGCRTFWCERTERDRKIAQDDLNQLVRRVQEIATRHEPGGDRGRPLTRALASAR